VYSDPSAYVHPSSSGRRSPRAVSLGRGEGVGVGVRAALVTYDILYTVSVT